MEQIPTAKEFLKKKRDLLGVRHGSAMLSPTEEEETMVEFAKLHVKAALEAAAENVWSKVDKDSIRNAYPEHLIK